MGTAQLWTELTGEQTLQFELRHCLRVHFNCQIKQAKKCDEWMPPPPHYRPERLAQYRQNCDKDIADLAVTAGRRDARRRAREGREEE